MVSAHAAPNNGIAADAQHSSFFILNGACAPLMPDVSAP
jgi:hypothetical protein